MQNFLFSLNLYMVRSILQKIHLFCFSSFTTLRPRIVFFRIKRREFILIVLTLPHMCTVDLVGPLHTLIITGDSMHLLEMEITKSVFRTRLYVVYNEVLVISKSLLRSSLMKLSYSVIRCWLPLSTYLLMEKDTWRDSWMTVADFFSLVGLVKVMKQIICKGVPYS